MSSLLAIGFATALWLGDDGGPDVVSKSSTTEVREGPAGAKTTIVRARDASDKATSRRSETVVATLYGLGAVLLLCGAFFPRIAKISLPGGAGIELTTDQQTAVVKQTVAAANAVGVTDEEAIARTFRRAVELATQPERRAADDEPRALSAGASGDDRIAAAVRTAADEILVPPGRRPR